MRNSALCAERSGDRGFATSGPSLAGTIAPSLLCTPSQLFGRRLSCGNSPAIRRCGRGEAEIGSRDLPAVRRVSTHLYTPSHTRTRALARRILFIPSVRTVLASRLSTVRKARRRPKREDGRTEQELHRPGTVLDEPIPREGVMAFDDSLARDPRTEDEFWKIIEDTFAQVEPTLTVYPVETREEALEPQRYAPGDVIRYRGASEDYDSRDYFLALGRKFVPRVKRQIKGRRLTPKFAKDWGVVMMCHGFIAAHVLDDSDALGHVRAGLKAANRGHVRCRGSGSRTSYCR